MLFVSHHLKQNKEPKLSKTKCTLGFYVIALTILHLLLKKSVHLLIDVIKS